MMKKKYLVILLVLAVFFAGCTRKPDPEQPSGGSGTQGASSESSSQEPAADKPYIVDDLLDTFDWCGRPVSELRIHKSYIGSRSIEIAGKLFGADAVGTAYFEAPYTEEKIVGSIDLYVDEKNLPSSECLKQIRALYGGPNEQGEEPYEEVNGGSVWWEVYDTGIGELRFSEGSENSWYSLIYMLQEGKTPSDYTGRIGDFDISNPQWCWISWDADGDGKDEELEFHFEDLGDEAPSYIDIMMYAENGEQEIILDRAYGVNRIYAKEDDEGPYLQIYYDMGDFYSHDTEKNCILRLENGHLTLFGDFG